jgi:hypothetical protein
MKKFLRQLYIKVFRPYVVADTQLVSYADADALIKLDPAWEIAKQEDWNLEQGVVWIQKRYYITE